MADRMETEYVIWRNLDFLICNCISSSGLTLFCIEQITTLQHPDGVITKEKMMIWKVMFSDKLPRARLCLAYAQESLRSS